MTVAIVVRWPHDESLEYHEWITFENESEWTRARFGAMRVKLDSVGRLNHSMRIANAQRWICNEPDCHAVAFVPDEFIRAAIRAADR